MTGPEHYREAERLAEAYKEAIAAADAMPTHTPSQSDRRHFAATNARALLAKADVHATLALAAAAAARQSGGVLVEPPWEVS